MLSFSTCDLLLLLLLPVFRRRQLQKAMAEMVYSVCTLPGGPSCMNVFTTVTVMGVSSCMNMFTTAMGVSSCMNMFTTAMGVSFCMNMFNTEVGVSSCIYIYTCSTLKWVSVLA